VCTAYAATVQLYDAPKLSSDFLALAESLPDNYDLDAYSALMQTFGTHVINGMLLGGRFGQQSTFTTEDYTQMLTEKVDIEASAGFSAWSVSVDAEAMSSTEKEQASKFSKKSSSSVIFNIGGEYKSNAEKWISTVRAFPMPVSMDLTQLDELFDERYMSPKLAAKKSNVQQAMREYCMFLRNQGKVESCDPLKPDGPLPQIPTIHSSTTPWGDSPDALNYHYLERHNVVCGSKNSGIQRFQFERGPNAMRYQYSCAQPVTGLGQCYSSRTPTTSPSNTYQKDSYTPSLKNQAVVCRDRYVLNQFALRTDPDWAVHYDYTCCTPPAGKPLGKCRTVSTHLEDNGAHVHSLHNQDWWDYRYLDRHDVGCTSREAMSGFQLMWPTHKMMYYQFTCCELPIQ